MYIDVVTQFAWAAIIVATMLGVGFSAYASAMRWYYRHAPRDPRAYSIPRVSVRVRMRWTASEADRIEQSNDDLIGIENRTA